MSGNNEGSGSWSSTLLTGAIVVVATAVVADGLYALLYFFFGKLCALLSFLFGKLYALLSSRQNETPLQVEGWKKPEIGWVKLNVDGSREHHGPSPTTGCGGVFRDALGTWLYAFALKLDRIYEAHETELQAILVGMQLASKMKFESSEMKFEKVIVESDNEDVVRMVEKNTLKYKKHRREYGVVQSIRELRFDPKWQVELVYISRDANGVANGLARKACTLSSDGLREYLSPPDGNIKSFHLKDIGQSHVRVV